MAKFDKLIITAAICGAEILKEDNPYLPTTPEELSDEAARCFDAGARIVHLHVRDEDGKPTQNGEIFTKTVNMIREKAPELIVQVSTGGATWMTADERIDSIKSKPDMATLSTGTSNFGTDVFMNTKEMVIEFAEKLNTNNIMPEFECFEVGHVSFAKWLIQKEYVKRDHYHFDFVMGVPGAIPATIDNLCLMKNMVPENATWCVAGIGRQELNMAAIAIASGGHVRVGMEDNIYLSKGVLAKSNAELVERVVNVAKNLNREIATPQEVKELFRLK